MNEIVKLVATALPNEQRYILLCGAGISKDAGVPTGWDIMLNTAEYLRSVDEHNYDKSINIEDWLKQSQYKDLTYSEMIEKVFPTVTAQQEYLSKQLENKECSPVHLLISQLAKRNIIKAVITTNFDKYIEKALEKDGIEYQVISNNDDLVSSEPLIHCKKFRIYKPHGTIGIGKIRNTPADLKEFNKEYTSELKKIISEHGLIILGYAGNEDDIALLNIIEDSNFYGRQVYPTFWINPANPIGRMKEILDKQSAIRLKYGASEFLNSFFEIQERLNDLLPDNSDIKTIQDIEYAFERNNKPIKPLYKLYLNGLKTKIENTRPDFRSYSNKDDAIFEQISNTKNILIDFIRASKLAIDYEKWDIVKLLYENFWNLSYFYSIPKGYKDSFQGNLDFNGFQFLIIEMFTSFVALLIKEQKFDTLGELLNINNMTKQTIMNNDNPVDYTYFYRFMRFAQIRNERLGTNRKSIAADIIKEDFDNNKINKFITFDEYIEADYLLHVYANTKEKHWFPISAIYMENTPEFLTKLYKRTYLEDFLKNLNLSKDILIAAIESSKNEFDRKLMFDLDFWYHFKIDNIGKF